MAFLDRLASFVLPAKLRQRIASVDRDPYRQIYGGQVPTEDPTLRARGRGKGIWLYDEVEQDPHAFAVLQKRKYAVIHKGWRVDPGGDSAADRRAAEMVKAQLGNLVGDLDACSGFDGLCLHLLDAVLKGFAVAEIDWQRDGKEIVANQIWPVDQRRMVAAIDDGRYQFRLVTRDNLLIGEEIPEQKFLIHTLGSKTGDPRGLGLGSRLWWPVYFKRQDIAFWLSYADRFGSPIPVGKYPPSATPEEQNTLVDALQAFGQEAGLMIPEGMIVDLITAGGNGSAEVYEGLARWCDEQISECVLGETGSTNQSVGGGSRARDEVGDRVRMEIVQADSDLLSATLNKTLVRWIVELNVPGAKRPTVWRDFEDQEDLNSRADRDQILFGLGYRLSLEKVLEVYGEGYELVSDTAAETPGDPVDEADPPVTEDPPAFAAPDRVAEVAQQMRRLGDPLIRIWTDQLQAILETSVDLEDFRQRLDRIYPDLEGDDLTAIMAQAMRTAELLGVDDA